MACGGLVPSQPLLTVLVSARAWLEEAGSVRDTVNLQLSVDPERAGDFRLSVRRSQAAAARGPAGLVIGDFQLRDVLYDMQTPRCHQLTVLGRPPRIMTFQFDDEQEAQKWWTVVSSSVREARRVAQPHVDVLGSKPPLANKPRLLPDVIGFKSPTTEDEPLKGQTDLGTKEDLAVRLGRCIEAGDQVLAAQYASELAKQKVPVQLQLKPLCYPKNEICMKVGVEDASASVNISTYVTAQTTIALLKQQIFREYQFHPSIQRWIIGQCLCSDDRTVGSYGIRKDGDTAFLYLLGAKQAKLTPQDQCASSIFQPFPLYNTVPARPSPKNGVSQISQPEKMEQPHHNLGLELNQKHQIPPVPPSPAQPGWSCPQCTFINRPTRPGCEICTADRPADYMVPEEYKPDEIERRRLQLVDDSFQQYNKALEEERQQNFLHILQLDNEVLIPNQEPIECRICYTDVPAGGGVLLRECLHSFCRECLRQVVNCCEDPEVSCPFRDETYACDRKLQEREVRALVSAGEYTRFLERGLVVAESRSQNSYHCRSADCKGWCIYEDSVNEFICPICDAQNCLICKAIHNGMNCKEYQDDLRIRAQNDTAAKQTSDMLKTLVQMGEAMYCPACKIIVQKKDGCDWIRCTMCQTEICWVTKGPRWGPQGPGDTSGGCQCNMNGRKCDPRCQNCH
ncbi:ranBP-type and C3HC4-type zinc finger-containing protein 1-like [Bufo gargarizans]|uniref:ranBP-type and C3HC4-type zinc finger-containing protein 1-like n=1 Tax=Bufo gargarizans TaxID=30331 RepID=UPI001CF38788|nr:ranBP-type and C3HC4-type zinc finger-containing protein 1-like [Bufo gargarizans]